MSLEVALRSESTECVQKNPFLVTTSWDDGHPLDRRIADLLARYGLRGTFYVPLRNARPTMLPHEIRELSASFEIGAHTVNHVRLRKLSPSEARREIADSKLQLEDILGKPCSAFCFPGGSYTRTHLQMLREAGFAAARTVELLSFRRPLMRQGIAVIPTTLQAYPHGAASYLRNAAKRVSVTALWDLLLRFRTNSWPAFAGALLEHAASTGGVFHLWGHSWEIEETEQWQALDRTLAAISEYRQRASFVTNTELCGEIRKPESNFKPALLS